MINWLYPTCKCRHNPTQNNKNNPEITKQMAKKHTEDVHLCID